MNRVCIFVAALLLAGQCAYAQISSGLVAGWKLDESSGNATDVLGSLTLTNNNTTTYSAGKINNGAAFVAASLQNLSVTNPTSLHLDSGTVAGWVKLTDLPTEGERYAIASKFVGGGNGWMLDVATDSGVTKFRAVVVTSTTGTVTTRSDTFGSPSTGTWYFVAMTWDQSNVKISVNAGAQDSATAVGTLTAETNDFYLGKAYAASPSCMNGMLDEVFVWNRALNTTEISFLYNGGNGRPYPFANQGGSFFLFFQ